MYCGRETYKLHWYLFASKKLIHKTSSSRYFSTAQKDLKKCTCSLFNKITSIFFDMNILIRYCFFYLILRYSSFHKLRHCFNWGSNRFITHIINKIDLLKTQKKTRTFKNIYSNLTGFHITSFLAKHRCVIFLNHLLHIYTYVRS